MIKDPNPHDPSQHTDAAAWHCAARIDPSLDLTIFVKSEQLPAEMPGFCTLRRTLDHRLQNGFLEFLTDFDAKILSDQGLNSPDIRNRWDESIIDAAKRYGTLILLSDLVLRRVHVWRTGFGESGPDLSRLKRFLNAILEEAEIRGGGRSRRQSRKSMHE